MRLVYADPPYYGCCKLYGHFHPDGKCWDDLDTHRDLIARLSEFDGWAMSLTSVSLRDVLPLCPDGVRVASWTKPFAAFKRNVRVAYTWEPVIFHGGRLSSTDGATPCRDHLAESITLKRGLTGAKPHRFNQWVLDLLGYVEGDTLTDLYPGTAGMARALDEMPLPTEATR